MGKRAFDEGYGFSRVSMILRLTQGDENRGEAVFDCAENDCPMRALAPEVRSYLKASS
jgi:hypothetical protein